MYKRSKCPHGYPINEKGVPIKVTFTDFFFGKMRFEKCVECGLKRAIETSGLLEQVKKELKRRENEKETSKSENTDSE